MRNLIYWMWLSLSVTPGTQTFAKLIEKFLTPEAIYNAEDYEIKACIGSKSRDYKTIMNKSLERAEKILSFCEMKDVGILTYDDPAFPENLKKISEPPVLLYYRGVLPDFNKLCCVAVVGTRWLTDYGRRNAFSIAHDLARAGVVIVSGMAIGIDGVAASAALSVSGQTVALLGSGIDVCYPDVHITLARSIVKNGCVMTEYPPATKPERKNFPRRNRLISGICCATIVIEGDEKSGALITARCAKEQGRPIYALPGNVDNKTSKTTNVLIKNGAKLITDAYDVIADFEFKYHGRVNLFKTIEPSGVRMFDVLREYRISCVTPSDSIFNPRSRKKSENKSKVNEAVASAEGTPAPHVASAPSENFDKFALQVYKRIPPTGDCPIDTIVESGEDIRDVMKALLKLDMGNFIEMLPGETVRRKLK